MEIERKFLIDQLPGNLSEYPSAIITQAYICTDPVIRIRQKNDDYILTVKSRGLLCREETELPISEDSFSHLLTKTEGNIIEKRRYLIPEKDGLTIELDIFGGMFAGLIMAEVEFQDMIQARAWQPPLWFGREVTEDKNYQNANLSRMSPGEFQNMLQQP